MSNIKYAKNEVFLSYKEGNLEVESSKEDFYTSYFKSLLDFENPSYWAVLKPGVANVVDFERNRNIFFGEKEESLFVMADSILPSQIGVVNKIDAFYTRFILNADLPPYSLKFVSVFNVEIVKGDVRTLCRKIVPVAFPDDEIIYGLVLIEDVTSLVEDEMLSVDFIVSEMDLDKGKKVDAFIEKIKNIIENETILGDELLSKREREILALIKDGLTSREVADKLNISKTTVDTHRQNMLRKYDVSNVFELLKKVKY